jgi:hypothetical protein
VEEQIKSKSMALLALQSSEGHVRNEEEAALKADLNSLLEQEEQKWKQRAKENWLKNGDRNIKYFHACASQRSKKMLSMKCWTKTAGPVRLKMILRMLLRTTSKSYSLQGTLWRWKLAPTMLRGRLMHG